MGNFLGCGDKDAKKGDDAADGSKIQTIDEDVDKKADGDVDKKADKNPDAISGKKTEVEEEITPPSSVDQGVVEPSAPQLQESAVTNGKNKTGLVKARPEGKTAGGGTRKKKGKTKKRRKGSLRKKSKTPRKPRNKPKRKTKNVIKY